MGEQGEHTKLSKNQKNLAGLFHKVLDVIVLQEKRSENMTIYFGGEMKKREKKCPTAFLRRKKVNGVINTM